ncbi:MAG: ATP-binding cassette domain-containing protein [Deltaproteobacteria bacterium]|nr:ATP-binding cassette domain-containing protein [Deltaproteobacteria bacterium]
MLGLRCEKRFGDFQLKADVLLDATATCIFGPSGCGKTTIARMAAGLLSPDAGEIRWGDDLLFSSDARINRPPRERGIAYVPQDVLLFPHMTVRKNLLYGFERTAPSRRAIHPDDVISLLELGAMLDKNPHQLSGGQAQRVAIGRALLSNPNLLVMDEPLSSLDRALKRRILAYLREIPNRFGVRLMYVTHAIDEIFGVGEKVLLMRPGRFWPTGRPSNYSTIPPFLRQSPRKATRII